MPSLRRKYAQLVFVAIFQLLYQLGAGHSILVAHSHRWKGNLKDKIMLLKMC